MYVLKSNTKGNFSNYVFGKCLFLEFSRAISENWESLHLLFENILNYFVCVDVRILVEK